ncbi:ABC transporter permease [Jiella marina]|uniref:ABC transporter permease n=1 Tax=Jiella sp. LLJ827 TaxID=2917712 RepID=UPI002100C3C4|nr:ABC transporter permease subunit [Jiella sp. LLJ827]MCQ0988336.1 ABC transporter permease subunit [Jiella sp. LLJ827]
MRAAVPATTSFPRFSRVVRPGFSAWAIAGLLALPVGVGLAGAMLPAVGYMPALGGTTFSLAPFRALFAQPGLAASIGLSLASGLLTTAVSTLGVALFLAAFHGTIGHRVARRALAPLLAVPHAAAAFGLAFLIAPSGLLFRLLALPFGFDRPPDLLILGDPLGLAMMAGLVAKEMPFLLLVALAALSQADPDRRMALARSLGYGKAAAFLMTVWPTVYRQIRLPVLAVTAYASGVVDVALILGPSTPAPLAVRLLGWMNDADLSLRFMASAGAILQVAVTGAVLGIWLLGERLTGAMRRQAATTGHRYRRDTGFRIVGSLPVALAGSAVFLGLLLLLVWSFAGFWGFPDVLPPSYNLTTWERVLPAAAGPMATTFLVAILAASAALALVVVLLESRRCQFRAAAGRAIRLQPAIAGLIYLPLIVPQIAFVFGLQVLVMALRLEPTILLLAVVHLIFVAPYVALALADPWYALDPRYEQVSASLGHGPITRLFRVRLPMLTAPVLTAVAIGFATSVGQYLPTVLIGAGRLPTITTEAVALASGGNRRIIGAYALLQTLLPFLAFSLSGMLPRLLSPQRRAKRAP